MREGPSNSRAVWMKLMSETVSFDLQQISSGQPVGNESFLTDDYWPQCVGRQS